MGNYSRNRLKYRVIGNGHPVVFLHGYLESMTMWNGLNRTGYKSVDFDLHGHGRSLHVLVPETLEQMALDIMEEIESLGVDRYSLVGHSMGGYIGLELLKNDPKCQKMMLLNSNFWEDSTRKINDRKRVAKIVETNASLFLYEAIPNLFLDPKKNDREVKLLIAEAMKMLPAEIGKASLAMSRRKSHERTVEANAKNVWVVQGEQDPIVSCQRMREAISGLAINYHELSDVGHMTHIESSNVIDSLLRAFVR
ncbi:MAG: alpha/beta hydrolase [Crocinitomicaceae bacterium]|nr:alpha/beta hydrolase [Crocinitomicaceae bacterium]